MSKILIIEDDNTVRENISEFLEINGYSTNTATNGLEGLMQAIQTKPDLIVCDIMMPEMDGIEVLNGVREHVSISNTPFIFLTAKVEKKNFRDAMSIGADDYLTKPFDLKELLDAVKIRLKKQTAIREMITLKANETRDQINRTANHEFNTPIYGIVGSSKMLLDYYDELTRYEYKDLVKAIYQSAIRLQHTLEQDLLYSKLNQIEKDPESIKTFVSGRIENAELIIKEVSQDLGNDLSRNKDISLNLEEGSIQISRENFVFICTEILNNAIKFSAEGSHISITSEVKKNFYEVNFSDKGYGIKKEFLDRIEPFMQFDRSTNEQQGRGLGLFLVNKILSMHGGKLKIESDEVNGTSVNIWIPTTN